MASNEWRENFFSGYLLLSIRFGSGYHLFAIRYLLF